MELSFATKLPNSEPSLFREKIFASWVQGLSFMHKVDFSGLLVTKASLVDAEQITPKLHTIRKGKRWKLADTIHFVIGARTKKRQCFAEGICLNVQDIRIWFMYGSCDCSGMRIEIEGRKIGGRDLKLLYTNDGFDALNTFEYFFWKATKKGEEIFEGQIIHWTNHKY